MADFKNQILKLLLENRRQHGSFQYTVPSPDTYPYQWLWDSCFHAIILTHYRIEDAKKEILSVLSRQFDNGMIPHMIYWDKSKPTNFPDIEWGKEDTSTITQPPMPAYAVWKIFEKDKDRSFLKKVYPNLKKFYQYLLSERDPHKNHLIGIMNPDESGEDNSPRFDLPLSLPSDHIETENFKRRIQLLGKSIECRFDSPFCLRNIFWVKDVPFNAIMIENLRLVSVIAKTLGYPQDAKFFSNEKENMTRAMKKLMLGQDLFWSIYWPNHGESYFKIKLKTWAIFAPLFAKILTKKEAKKLVRDHLLNKKEFWTKYLVPTVSISEPSFDPKGFWRGPVWIATNWFIYKGLVNYGFLDIAKKIKESSLELIQKSGFREYFNPQTGKGFGARDFTWGGLVIDMD